MIYQVVFKFYRLFLNKNQEFIFFVSWKLTSD